MMYNIIGISILIYIVIHFIINIYVRIDFNKRIFENNEERRFWDKKVNSYPYRFGAYKYLMHFKFKNHKK